MDTLVIVLSETQASVAGSKTPVLPHHGCAATAALPAVRDAAIIRSGMSPKRPIYFDYNATTPLDPGVREAMLPLLGEIYGNPSSVHQVGRQARARLDDARDRVAAVFHCKPSEIVFTSGGTESNTLALCGAARRLRARGRHLITAASEHHAVLSTLQALASAEGFELTILPVDQEGLVAPDSLLAAFRADTLLVSIMGANNETGAIQPIAELGRLCRSRGVLFHTDAVQWFGKLPFHGISEFEADLVTLCAHKMHGPKGAGLLYIRSPLQLEPLLRGGAHELERRAGTENLAGIVGLAEAAHRFLANPVFPEAPLLKLSSQLRAGLSLIPGVSLVGTQATNLPNTVAVTVTGCDSTALLAGLDLDGICASSGSACSSGSLEPSHVLLAMGRTRAEASSLVRFSLGRETTADEVETVIKRFAFVVHRIRESVVV